MVAKAESGPNLAVVDEAFGPGSDLYLDVLQVQPNAGTGQIQDAYFDRRNELFQLLADIDGDNEQDSITESHRRSAERKMDAVVCSVRILGDPDLRLQYDDLRSERLKVHHVVHNNNQKKNIPKRSKPRRSATHKSKRGGAPPAVVEHEDHPTAPDDEARGDLRQQPCGSSQSSQSSDYSPGRYEANSDIKPDTTTKNNNDPSFRVVAPPVYTQRSPPKQQLQPPPPSSSRKNKNTTTTTRAAPVVVSPEIQVRRLQAKVRAARGAAPSSPKRAAAVPKRLPNKGETTSDTESFDDNESNTLGSDSLTMMSDDEDETLFTYDDGSIDESIIRKTLQKPKGFLDRIRLEAIGACDDTARSFAQVCNAFTLQEADIKAVMGRIDKASRQLQEGVATTRTTSPDRGGVGADHASRKSGSSSRSSSRGRRLAATNGGRRKSPAGGRRSKPSVSKAR